MQRQEESAELKDLWRSKYALARSFMAKRAVNTRTLIEIAAQHPLLDGVRPNREFSARLDRGQELFYQCEAFGNYVEIYVPGSRHTFEGKPDRISLSEAGQASMIRKGILSSAIHGDDLNARYKGSEGVYGSADECFVAASHYKDGDFGTLISVCSPAQMLRKTLHYIEFGVIPLNYTVPVADGFHNYLEELFEKIPRVLSVDPRLQGDSADARTLREERKPGDQN